jgi:crotonobetainyl-CoA:carnitine CoA-transferase CaiB-like acyl-CoA transferase
MGTQGPLAGVRVVEVADDGSRSAGKLLAELGADVVQVGRGTPGPAMVGPAAAQGGLLDWWWDGGKRRVDLDLDGSDGREAFLRLVDQADILVETQPPGRMAELGLDHESLAARNPALVHVSLTPFGADGPRARWRTSDLVASALGGWLSVTGWPDRPVPMWGRQSALVGGSYAALSALAGLREARETGRGCHVDLSLHQAVASCTEHVLMFWWYPEAMAMFGAPLAVRQGSLHWIRAYVVFPCKRGYCMVSPSANGVPELLAWMREEGFGLDIPEEFTPAEAIALIPRMMSALAEFALSKDATELFEGGQARHVPFGEVLTVPQVGACAQHLARGFFRPVAVPGAPADADVVPIPGPFCRFEETSCPPPAPPPSDVTAVDELVEQWSTRRAAGAGVAAAEAGAAARAVRSPSTDASALAATRPGDPRSLAGLRVLDFTHVLAGPVATRVLGDLGADIVKLQTESRSQGAHANDFPYFAMWNRNKRSVTLDMKHPGALGVFRRLVEQADVVIDNFSAGVLRAWGAGPDVLAGWNPRIVTVSMTGAGEDGPWRDFVTFAPTVHALCGLTALTGPDAERLDCGSGVAFNDHASGLVGAVAVLAAIEARRVTGRGQHLDMSQLEVGTTLVGPALIDHLANGRVAVAAGCQDPFESFAVNDVVRAADGEWLAVTARAGVEVDALQTVTGGRDLSDWVSTVGAGEAAERLQAAGVPAGLVQNAAHLTGSDPQLAHRNWLVDMPSDVWGTQHTDRFPARWYDAEGHEVTLEYRASPGLGEQNFEVYPELLGWDEGRVAEAMADGLFS